MSHTIGVELKLTYSDTGTPQVVGANIEAVDIERHGLSVQPGGSQVVDVQHPGGEKLCTLVLECGVYDGSMTYKIDGGNETPLTQPLVLLGQNPSGLVNPQPQAITIRNNGAAETMASLVAAFAA
jgi:hypothetical protein